MRRPDDVGPAMAVGHSREEQCVVSVRTYASDTAGLHLDEVSNRLV
jgi:hypothetical protein